MIRSSIKYDNLNFLSYFESYINIFKYLSKYMDEEEVPPLPL